MEGKGISLPLLSQDVFREGIYSALLSEISPYINIGYKSLFSEGLKYGIIMENCLPPTTCQAHHLRYTPILAANFPYNAQNITSPVCRQRGKLKSHAPTPKVTSVRSQDSLWSLDVKVKTPFSITHSMSSNESSLMKLNVSLFYGVYFLPHSYVSSLRAESCLYLHSA